MFQTDNGVLAGVETDAAIAVSVFGWRWLKFKPTGKTVITPPRKCDDKDNSHNAYKEWEFFDEATSKDERFESWDSVMWMDNGIQRCGLPRYSTNLKDAFEIVSKMEEQGFFFTLTRKEYEDGLIWSVEFRYDSQFRYVAEAETIPLAICRAAVVGLNFEKEEVQG